MPPILLSEMLCGKNPTVIVSTRNPDGSINLTVCSDLYLLAKHFVLTLPSESQTIGNLLSAKNCVLNIPPQKLAPALRRLMRTTGSRGFAAAHNGQGLRYTRAKFAKAKLTPCRSIEVATAGVEECPIRVEAELVHVHCSPDTSIKAVELRVLRVNADTSIMKVGSQSEIDSEKWQPIQSDSRDLRVAPEQATHLENQAGDNDDTQKANALDNSPTDLRGECLGSDVLLIQLHAIGLVLGCVLFFVCQ